MFVLVNSTLKTCSTFGFKFKQLLPTNNSDKSLWVRDSHQEILECFQFLKAHNSKNKFCLNTSQFNYQLGF